MSSEMAPRERLLASLSGRSVDKVPACSVTQTGTVELMELSGAHWPEAHFNARSMAALAVAGHRYGGLEGIRYPFDITSPAPISMISPGTGDSQPAFTRHPCRHAEDVHRIDASVMVDDDRMSTIVEATDILREEAGEQLPLIAGGLGPAGFAFAMAGVENLIYWSMSESDLVRELLRTGTRLASEYSNSLLSHGADVVTIPEGVVGPDLMPPDVFRSLVMPEYLRFNSMVSGLTILHMCGDATLILDDMAESGFNGISIEEKVDMGTARNVIGRRACLIGNISAISTLLLKTPSDIEEEAFRCLEDGVDVLAPSCGLAPYTPLENIRALVASRDHHLKRV